MPILPLRVVAMLKQYLVCFSLAAVLPAASVQVPVPSSLRVMGSSNEVALQRLPVFSVGVDGPREIVHQGSMITAFQLIVEAYGWNETNRRVVWDTGKVDKPHQLSWIEYAGEELQSNTQYKWRARIWTDIGGQENPSDYAEGPSFRTGLLSEPDWQGAQWVGNAQTNRSVPESSASQLVFSVDLNLDNSQALDKATCFVAGLGAYAAWVGGAPLGPDRVHASVTEWRNRTLYDVFDCSEAVKQGLAGSEDGKLRVSFELGRWWWAIWNDYFYNPPMPMPQGARMVRFVIQYSSQDGAASGTVVSSATDAMLGAGDLVQDDMHLGEHRSGARATPGWTGAAFAPAGPAWRPADALQGPSGAMEVTQEPPIQVLEELHPRYIGSRGSAIDGVDEGEVDSAAAKGTQLVFDVGREISGNCGLVLRTEGSPSSAWCTAGTSIELVYGETLFDNGTVMPFPTVPDRVHGGREKQMSRYTCGGNETSDPPAVPNRFMYTGFRYVAVIGWGGAAPSAANPVLHCKSFHTDLANGTQLQLGPATAPGGIPHAAAMADLDVTAGYVLTRVVNATRASGALNFVSIPTDCPTREKRGWMGDSGAALLFMGAAFDMHTAYRKWLTDIRQSQSYAVIPGSMGQMEPSIFLSISGKYTSDTAWGGAFPIIYDYTWRHYGDQEILRSNFEGVKAYVDMLLGYTNSTTGLLPTSYPGTNNGDWCAIHLGPTQGCNHVSNPLNSYYLLTGLDAVARAAKALNRTAIATRYSQLGEQARASYVAAFFNETSGEFRDPNLPTHTPHAVNYRPPLQTTQGISMVGKVLENPASQKKGAEALKRSAVSTGHTMQAGMVGSAVLTTALQENGFEADAAALLTNTGLPSYYWMATTGGSTIWERWYGSYQNGSYSEGSWAHIMLGGSVSFAYTGIGGVRPLHADAADPWAEAVLSPRPDLVDVAWVAGSRQLSRGLLAVNGSATRLEPAGKGGSATMISRASARVPLGVRAHVVLPAGEGGGECQLRETNSGRVMQLADAGSSSVQTTTWWAWVVHRGPRAKVQAAMRGVSQVAVAESADSDGVVAVRVGGGAYEFEVSC